MADRLKILATIIALTLVPTALLWLPFFFRVQSIWGIPLPQDGLATVVANYDGPLYLVVAKSLYNPEIITGAFSFPLPTEYYAAHFPLYPLLIRLVAFATYYPYAMLIITLITSVFALYFFYRLAELTLKNPKDALWLTIVFSVFPARWLIVRSVGSPEPLFIGAILASLYYFKNKQFWMAGVFGAIAQLTKSPGILLFIAYLGAIAVPALKVTATAKAENFFKSLEWRAYPILLIPLALFGLFVAYGHPDTFDNYFAYFHSGDNIHLEFPPFQIFNYAALWVNTHWLEEILFIYLFAVIGVLRLVKQQRLTLAWFTGIFFVSIIFVSHRDVLRYSLPIVPLLFISYADTIKRWEFKFAFAFLLLPIYLYALAFISNNVMPVADWSSLL